MAGKHAEFYGIQFEVWDTSFRARSVSPEVFRIVFDSKITPIARRNALEDAMKAYAALVHQVRRSEREKIINEIQAPLLGGPLTGV